ncbi:MAG: fatty acid desaturase [Gammaproteobacteria bacterium]|nr:fatty acid desaturase [Gammaproteobacteria bacterium]
MPTHQALGDAELNPNDLAAGARTAVAPNDEPAVSRRPGDLVPRETIERLYERSDRIGLGYFCAHFALIGAGAWCIWASLGTYWFWPLLVLQSIVLGFLFSPLHECAHGTAFRTRWLNETVLWLVAIVYIVPPYFFRYFHLGHHRYTQVPGKDPSLVLPEPANVRQYVWYVAALWFWWRNLRWMVRHAFGLVDPSASRYVPSKRLGLMVTESRLMFSVYGGVFALAAHLGFLPELIACWLLPRFLGEPLQRVIRVAEHVGCEESSNLLANTRTTLSNPLFNALAWQMPYHAEHHLFPNVPFHSLRTLHAHVASHVVVEARGYVAGQRDIIAMLRADKKDPDARERASIRCYSLAA